MEPAAAWAAAAAGGADGAAGAAGVLAATTTSSDLAVFVPARAAREIKVALEARGWYDRTRLIGPGGGAGMMAVPVSRGGASDVAALLARLAADGGAAAAAAAEADGAVFVQVLGVARVGAAADLRPAKVARLAAARAADAAAAPAGGGGGGGGGGGDRGARRAVAVGVAQQPARPWRGPRYAPVPELRCVGICGGGGGDGGMQNRMGGGGDGGGGGGGGEEAVVRAISAALAARAPVALRGAYGAGVVASWAPEALRAATARGCGGGACGGECGGDGCRVASVHGSATPRLDFVCKNYAFVPMLLCDALGACLGWHVPSGGGAAEAGGAEGAAALSGRHLYMRAMASHARRDVADFWADFRALPALLPFPAALVPPGARVFSSVLRIATPGLQLWTHYDVMDNVLIQVRVAGAWAPARDTHTPQLTGRKRVVLWPPSCVCDMYLVGSSSRVTDIDGDDGGDTAYPRFASARSRAIETVLEPGDAIFIPALWFHNVTTIGDSGSVGVNVFWKDAEMPDGLFSNKDLYGNHDPPVAARAVEAACKAAAELSVLPRVYREFYARQAMECFVDLIAPEECPAAGEAAGAPRVLE